LAPRPQSALHNGSRRDIEKERSGIETDFKVKAVHSPGRHDQARRDREMVALGRKTSARSISWSTMRIRSSRRSRSSAGEMGSDHRDQPVVGFLRHPCRGPRQKERALGRIQSVIGPFAVASPFNRPMSRPSTATIAGLTKTVALEVATFKITFNCISPGYVWTALHIGTSPMTNSLVLTWKQQPDQGGVHLMDRSHPGAVRDMCSGLRVLAGITGANPHRRASGRRVGKINLRHSPRRHGAR